MQRLISLSLAALMAMFLSVGFSGCRVVVDEEGPIEEVAEELDD